MGPRPSPLPLPVDCGVEELLFPAPQCQGTPTATHHACEKDGKVQWTCYQGKPMQLQWSEDGGIGYLLKEDIRDNDVCFSCGDGVQSCRRNCLASDDLEHQPAFA